MPQLIEATPHSEIEVVTDILHGVPVSDPYRWLEDQNSARTRAWITEQTRYARSYLDSIPGRDRIRECVQELLDQESFDSFLKVGSRYFFRKRLRGQEQPGICMRESPNGEDQLLVDPAARKTGSFTAVLPIRVSPNGKLLLYEIKHGGERTGTFELLDIDTRKQLADRLPSGILRGFVFASDSNSFYYTLESTDPEKLPRRAVHHHVLGTPPAADREIFFAGEDKNIRLFLIPGEHRMGIYINKYLDKTFTDFHVRDLELHASVDPIVVHADYLFEPRLLKDQILALTDFAAPNLRIVRVHGSDRGTPHYTDIVPERNKRLTAWTVVGPHLFVSYINGTRTEIHNYNLDGLKVDELPIAETETVRLYDNVLPTDELLVETESFTAPRMAFRYSVVDRSRIPLTERNQRSAAEESSVSRVSYPSKDGTSIPMFLVGKKEILAGGVHPTIMTSYGGYGVPMTPQFSVFVAFLVEQGCLFALPNIRGGSEFGTAWHVAAKRRNRQTAYDDFFAAAEWLIRTGRTTAEQLAIFGGSNSGLLVAVAMTQRPGLFRAVLSIAPLIDMLRFHLFDRSHAWKDEFGTAEDHHDFVALAAYSPYHHVQARTAYPATMIVSGGRDSVCNSLHARKMTARLQAASTSGYPIFLDYQEHRGHAPVLPFSSRLEALTDRIAFFCDQLHLCP